MGNIDFQFADYAYTGQDVYVVLTTKTKVWNPSTETWVLLSSLGGDIVNSTYGFDLTESSHNLGYFSATKNITQTGQLFAQYWIADGITKDRTVDFNYHTKEFYWSGTAEYNPEVTAQPIASVSPNTVGAAMASVVAAGSVQVVHVGLVDPLNQTINVIAGDDMYAVDGRSILFSSDDFPDLTDAQEIWFAAKYIGGNNETGNIGVVCTNAGANTQTLKLELSSEDTSEWPFGEWGYDIQSTLANGHKTTLVRGTMNVAKSYVAPPN